MTVTIKNIAQTALLCVGLVGANTVWSHSCPDAEVRAKSSTTPDVAQAAPLSASDQYEMFHDVRLNEMDGLGDYVHNFQED